MLSRWGMGRGGEADPVAARRALAQPGIGMVLCDWMMPGMSGPDFCRRLRAMERESYGYFVILLTAKTEKEARSPRDWIRGRRLSSSSR